MKVPLCVAEYVDANRMCTRLTNAARYFSGPRQDHDLRDSGCLRSQLSVPRQQRERVNGLPDADAHDDVPMVDHVHDTMGW